MSSVSNVVLFEVTLNAESELVVPEIDIFASSTCEFKTSKTDLGVSWWRLATCSWT